MTDETKARKQDQYLIKHIGGEENKETRTELPSLGFGVKAVAMSLLGFALIIIIN